MQNRFLKKSAALLLSLTLIFSILAACGKSETEQKKETVLRIAAGAGPNDEYFRQQFTELFEFANPNVKVEVVPLFDKDQFRYKAPEPNEKRPDPLEKMKELMQGANPPDVVMLGYEQLSELIGDNLLLPLDPLVAKDKFDTSDFVPAVIDGLKAKGDGKLYALAPIFSSAALVYNKKMFTDTGVSFPTDNMTWDQMFDLARRVSRGEGDNRTYGFSFNPYRGSAENMFYEMNMYTAPLQLRLFDDKGEKMTVDSPQWEKVWTTMLQLNKDKMFPEPQRPEMMRKPMNPGEYNPFMNDLFMSGKLAMTIMHYSNLNQIIDANKNAASIKGYTPLDWDVVTLPTHPEAPGVGGNMYMNGLMGINAKAQNPEDAWKFLKFINGPEWAKLKSRSLYQMVSRKSFIKAKDGANFNIAAFYQLKPADMPDNYKLYREKPYIGQAQSIGMQYFQQAMRGEKSVKDALKEWQTAGDAMLQQMKENPNQPLKMGPMGMSKAVPTR